MKFYQFCCLALLLLFLLSPIPAAHRHRNRSRPVSGAVLPLHWNLSLASALSESRSTRKPIMALFTATWCGACHLLETKNFTDPAVRREMRRWVLLKVDADRNQTLANQHRVDALPTIIFMTRSGRASTRLEGYDPTRNMPRVMRGARTRALRGLVMKTPRARPVSDPETDNARHVRAVATSYVS